MQTEKTEQLCAPSTAQAATGKAGEGTGLGPRQPLESGLPPFLTIVTHSQPSCQESSRRERHTKFPSLKRAHSLRALGSLGALPDANLPDFQHKEQGPLGASSVSPCHRTGCASAGRPEPTQSTRGLYWNMQGLCRVWSGVPSSGRLRLWVSLCGQEGEGHENGRRCLGCALVN